MGQRSSVSKKSPAELMSLTVEGFATGLLVCQAMNPDGIRLSALGFTGRASSRIQLFH
jgi:hypothetical protein